MGDFKYCKNCGTLFTSYGSKICPECMDKEEDEFRIVRDYIWDNPGGNMKQVAEATEVDLEKIMKWLREERLILKMEEGGEAFDSGLKCMGCGKNISSGKYCENCKGNLSRDLQKEAAAGKAKLESSKPAEGESRDRMFTATRRK